MTKEEWELIRDKEEIPISLYYEYYLEHRNPLHPLINMQDFTQIFERFLFEGEGHAINTYKGPRFIFFNRIIDKVYNYFNKKFI